MDTFLQVKLKDILDVALDQRILIRILLKSMIYRNAAEISKLAGYTPVEVDRDVKNLLERHERELER